MKKENYSVKHISQRLLGLQKFIELVMQPFRQYFYRPFHVLTLSFAAKRFRVDT